RSFLVQSLPVVILPGKLISRCHSGCAHHVQDACGETKQQKHDQSPRRDAEPPIQQPADQRSGNHARHKLCGKPKAARNGGRIGTRCAAGWRLDRPSPLGLAELGAETPEPRGERSLVGCLIFRTALVAFAVIHADTRACSRRLINPCSPKSRADHTDGVIASQELLQRRYTPDNKYKSKACRRPGSALKGRGGSAATKLREAICAIGSPL